MSIRTDLPLGGSGGGGSGTVTTNPVGGGTPGQIAKFTAPLVIGDSIINETGAVINIAGSLTINNPLGAGSGGTGIASYAVGDILYASGATTLSKLADVAAGSYLRSGGVTTAPLWSTLTLPNASSQGDLFTSTAANAMVVLAKNTTATRYLANTGASNNPQWDQVNLANGTTGTLPASQVGAGGSNTQVQYNNAGVLGGISNATSDGTTLSITSGKFITALNDTNGNPLITPTATASAVYGLTLTNAALAGTVALGVTAVTQVASSTAGTPISITAQPAVAGSSNNGAAAGGGITLATGAAARLVSGNANGGDITITLGAGIGTGRAGVMAFPGGSVAAPPVYFNLAGGGGGIFSSGANSLGIVSSATHVVQFTSSVERMISGLALGWTSSSTDPTQANDVALYRVAAKVVGLSAGANTVTGWLNWQGQARVSSQFDKVNATLADITGLVVACQSGRTYSFSSALWITGDATGGYKLAAAYSSTTSAIIFEITTINNGTAALTLSSKQTTSGGSAASTTGTDIFAKIEGTFTTTGAGNFSLQFAQSTANGTSSVLVGSFLVIHDMP